MTTERPPMEKIIRGWLGKLDGNKFDDRVNPNALLLLIKYMVHYGYDEDEIDTDLFKNKVVQRITHEYSKKPKAWRQVTWDKVDRAIGAWFALPDLELTEDELTRAPKAAEPRVHAPKPTEPEEESEPTYDEKPREIVPFDRSRFKSIQTTPVDTDDLLEELGLKDDE